MIWYPDILIVGQNESWCVAITRLLHRNTVVHRRLSYASKLTNSLSSSLSSRRRVVLVEAKLTVQRLTCRLVVREVEFIGSLAVLFLLTSLLQASLQFHRQPISTDFRFAGFNESRRKKEYDSPCFFFPSFRPISKTAKLENFVRSSCIYRIYRFDETQAQFSTRNNSFSADTNRRRSMKLLAHYLIREDNKIEGARTNLYVLRSWFNLDGNLTLCYCLARILTTIESIFH